MTKNSALQIVTETINACDLSAFNDEQRAKIADALMTIAGMREQLMKPRTSSPEAQAKRKEKSAQERANAIKDVLPIVRDVVYNTPHLTAKEIFEACEDKLPSDWTANKVQYLLLHELSDEIDKVEAKGKPNTYFIK